MGGEMKDTTYLHILIDQRTITLWIFMNSDSDTIQ